MRFLVVVAVGALLMAAGAAYVFFGGLENQPLIEARAEHARRVAALTPPAATGDVEAAYALATLHHRGGELGEDFAAALEWYKRAADKGHVGAQYALGEMHEKGQGVRADPFRAAEWYGHAARTGRNVDAQFALGNLYYAGRGVPHSYADAILWYERAARQGHPVAQYLMGTLSEQGWGFEADPVAAYMWYTLALAQAARVAAHNPAFDVKTARDKLARRLNQTQIAAAERRARELRPGQ
jgi:TPR repeat protein